MRNDIAPVEMVVLQGTPFCNLNCSYCDLSVESRKRRDTMSLSTLERVFTDIFENDLAADHVAIVWHSGEPLTLPTGYYQQAIDLITRLRNQKARRDIELEFDFQTNAVLISEDWIEFFKRNQHQLHLGVSCDGPASMHDAFRKNWGGKSTHSKVVAGMQKLVEAEIPFKVISVITDETLRDPDGFLEFFIRWSDALSGFHFNIIADGTLADQTGLTYGRQDRDRYYNFYRRLLRRTQSRSMDAAVFDVQNFTQAIARILRPDNDTVAIASLPIRTLNVDAAGFVTTFYAGLEKSAFADHYDDGLGLALGNILHSSLEQMLNTSKFRRISADFKNSQAVCKATCDYYQLCSGGFELSKLSEHGTYNAAETAACSIIVKTLADAVLDDIKDSASLSEAAE